MKTTLPVPASVDPMKVLEWTESTSFDEGYVINNYFKEVSARYCNWLMFYCWCYARTQGFTNKCMKNWDFGNFGGKFKTSREGVIDALSEFLKYPETESLAEQKEVEKLYKEICDFCAGIIYTPPQELPKPKPEPIPEPVPEPKPEPQPKPEEPKPNEPGKKFDWSFLKWLLPALGALATVGSLFLPGWAKTLIDVILKVLSGLSS